MIRRALAAGLVSLLCLLSLLTGGAGAQTAPPLGAVTNFAQGVQPQTRALGAALGITRYRDGMNWERVEAAVGRYGYGAPQLAYPDGLSDLTLVLNWGNRHYEAGATPVTPEGRAAMAAYAADLVRRFPAIRVLEIGNEWNSGDFLRGPLREMTALERADAQVALVREVAEAVRAVRPEVRILGGAAHSLPGAYLSALMGAGLGVDAIAIHPYTTPPEQFRRQMAVLRRDPLLAGAAFEVTEFSSTDPVMAGDDMLRQYCQFALAGIGAAFWYPANQRPGEAEVPLFLPDGRITEAGRAFRLIQSDMAGRDVTDAAPDALGHGCAFGSDLLVLWGAGHRVEVEGPVEALTAAGRPRVAPYALSERRVLVLRGDGVAGRVRIGSSGIVADSFHQFAYPVGAELRAPGDAFARFGRRGDGAEVPLVALPGQQRPGVPWTPHRGRPGNPGVRLGAQMLLPGADMAIVHRFEAASDQALRLSGDVAPLPRPGEGVRVAVVVDGAVVLDQAATAAAPLALDHGPFRLAAGAAVEITVTGRHLTRYRFTLRDAPE